MSDAWHTFGDDLTLAASGDLLTASGPMLAQQRVIRRLLTNPGDLIYHPEYGGGLLAMVGQPVLASAIQAIVLRQMQLEAGVSQNPSPTVSVSSDGSGFVSATITYTDANTGQPQTVTVPPQG